jgi:hypothetical protein
MERAMDKRKSITTSSVARVCMAVAIVAGGVLFGGCSTTSVRHDLDAIVMMSPTPVLVAKGHELAAAENAARKIGGAQAFLGVGQSMEPVYSNGTAIVTTRCEYAQLCAGMSVVYVNESGRGVAHVLVREEADGWVARGVNNAGDDSSVVTRANLVGVVTQAYASSITPLRREIASRAAAKMIKAMGPQLAGNFPAAPATN